MLYRLSLTEDPVWDRAAIRHVVDLLAVLEAAVARFGAVARDAGLASDGPDGGDLFTKGAGALSAARISTAKTGSTSTVDTVSPPPEEAKEPAGGARE